jgi:hypothetical protein
METYNLMGVSSPWTLKYLRAFPLLFIPAVSNAVREAIGNVV